MIGGATQFSSPQGVAVDAGTGLLYVADTSNHRVRVYAPDGSHPIQIASKELDTPQCGYCQSGMIMSALALLRERPTPSDADIDAQVTNACRCGTYHRVRQAIHLAADLIQRYDRRRFFDRADNQESDGLLGHHILVLILGRA